MEERECCLLKAPLSGSGKGLNWCKGIFTPFISGWCTRVAASQGGIIAEPIYNKVEGKEWFISLLLFSSPLFLEYIQYTSKNKLVNFIYIIQKICFAFTSMLGVIGVLTEIITIKINNAVSYIQISKTFFMLSGKEITIGWYCIH